MLDNYHWLLCTLVPMIYVGIRVLETQRPGYMLRQSLRGKSSNGKFFVFHFCIVIVLFSLACVQSKTGWCFVSLSLWVVLGILFFNFIFTFWLGLHACAAMENYTDKFVLVL